MRIEFSIWSHLIFFFLGIGVALWLSGCSAVMVMQEPQIFYLAGEVGILEQQELVELVITEIEDVSSGAEDWLRVDYLVEERVMNVYSSPPERRALWALIEDIPTLKSEDEALVSALYSLADLAAQNPDTGIQAVLVTDGSTDEDVIASLASVSKELAQYEKLFVSVVGVDPEHRPEFARAFSPMPAQITFSGSPEELATKFRSIGG